MRSWLVGIVAPLRNLVRVFRVLEKWFCLNNVEVFWVGYVIAHGLSVTFCLLRFSIR